MNSSWRIGQIAGISVYVHWTFALLLAFVALQTGTWNPIVILFAILLVLAVFACVVLHELGHALTARRFGIGTKDITLLPIGGVARLERMPEDPKQEILVAVAGPAVNVVIAAALIGLLLAMGEVTDVLQIQEGARLFRIQEGVEQFVGSLIGINVWLVLFNLLPAFPMDGGRVLRAILAMRLPYVRATRVAATIGLVMAGLFAIAGAGLFGNPLNPMLLVIAFFIFMAGQAEAQMVEARATFRGVPVGRAMITRFWTLSPSDPLSAAAAALLAGYQHDFPVLERGELVGILTRSALVQALSESGPATAVGSVMRRDCAVVDESEPLDRAYERMQQSDCSTAAVVRDHRLVGLLTLENIGEWIMVQSALADRARPRA